MRCPWWLDKNCSPEYNRDYSKKKPRWLFAITISPWNLSHVAVGFRCTDHAFLMSVCVWGYKAAGDSRRSHLQTGQDDSPRILAMQAFNEAPNGNCYAHDLTVYGAPSSHIWKENSSDSPAPVILPGFNYRYWKAGENRYFWREYLICFLDPVVFSRKCKAWGIGIFELKEKLWEQLPSCSGKGNPTGYTEWHGQATILWMTDGLYKAIPPSQIMKV